MSFQGEFVNVRNPDQYVYYTAPTEKGSSGAPVFGSDWQLIAVHSGSLMGANVGVRIDQAVRELRIALKANQRHQGAIKRIGL
jgi:V8-like Glu-specific endopeptidase